MGGEFESRKIKNANVEEAAGESQGLLAAANDALIDGYGAALESMASGLQAADIQLCAVYVDDAGTAIFFDWDSL